MIVSEIPMVCIHVNINGSFLGDWMFTAAYYIFFAGFDIPYDWGNEYYRYLQLLYECLYLQ